MTSDAIRVLSEIVVDDWGPFETKKVTLCGWDSVARGLFIHDDDNSDYPDDDSEDNSYTIDDDEEGDEGTTRKYIPTRRGKVGQILYATR